MAVETQILSNNVVLITESVATVKTAAVGFWFPVGSRHEGKGQRGVCHFVEHMVFKGTATRSAFDIALAFDRMGGYLNAFTDRETMCLHCVVPAIHLRQALEVMETTLLKTELQVQESVYGQLKSQYEMLKVTMASEQPVFQILEYAEVPDRKSGPSRGMLCIIVTFAAGFFSVFLAFLLNAIKNVRADPVAMAKLSSKRSTSEV